MNKKKRKTHWRHAYFKRINSTEVTVKRSRTKEETLSKKEDKIDIIPVFPKSAKSKDENENRNENKNERTPDRIINTPIRKIMYISPEKNIHIPPTPHSLAFANLGRARSCKRLFW